MQDKTDIKSFNYKELQEFVAELGEKSFRAKQIYEWLHVKQVESFSEMTNLSKAFQQKLEETCYLTVLSKEEVQISKIDGTRKYLFALEDGNVIGAGSHESLMESCEEYRIIAKTQMGDGKEDA